MAISIRQIHPVFVGEVSGIDLCRMLSSAEAATVAGDAPTTEQIAA